MQPNPLSQTFSRRVWRALSLGFSVTAFALNSWPTPSVYGFASKAAPARQLRHSRASAAEQSVPTLAPGQKPELTPCDDRALYLLTQRFSSAADADLAELAAALATLGDPRARAVLFGAARSARAAGRSAALEALSTLDSEDVRSFMVGALSQLEPAAAASYFSDCREPRALPALERLARSGSTEVRRAAIDALFAQGADAETAILRLLREDSELSEALLEGQPRTLGARRALRAASIARLDAGAVVSGRLFDFLEQDSSDESRAALLRAALDPGSAESASSALSKRGDSASLAALSRLANDTDVEIAAPAACALASQPDSRSRRVLNPRSRNP